MSDPNEVLLEEMKAIRKAAQVFARRNRAIDVEEMIAAGNLALVECLHRFDEDGGANFRTFALLRARGAMLDYLRLVDPLGRGHRKEVGSGFRPTEQFADEDLDEECPGVRLSQVAGSNADPLRLLMHREVREWIAEMPPRMRRVMECLLEDMTQSEIGRMLGVVESRVSQIAKSGVEWLRARAGRGKTMDEVQGAMRVMTFAPKVCICGCGETFTPQGPRQIFVMGHRMKTPEPREVRRHRRREKTEAPPKHPAPSAPSKPEPLIAIERKTESAVEMVTLEIPATSLDKFICLLPTQMKAEAVQKLLTEL